MLAEAMSSTVSLVNYLSKHIIGNSKLIVEDNLTLMQKIRYINNSWKKNAFNKAIPTKVLDEIPHLPRQRIRKMLNFFNWCNDFAHIILGVTLQTSYVSM